MFQGSADGVPKIFSRIQRLRKIRVHMRHHQMHQGVPKIELVLPSRKVERVHAGCYPGKSASKTSFRNFWKHEILIVKGGDPFSKMGLRLD